MAASKKVDVICVVLAVLALILTVLFINGKSLGLQVYTTTEETTENNSHFTSSDIKKEVDITDATIITMEGSSVTVSGNGAYFTNGVLKIVYKGTYVLKGSLKGQIEVDADGDDKVWLVMDGANVYCEDSAALYIKKADKVFLNLAEGSENSLECGSIFSGSAEKDKIKGAIQSKDNLTINGTGALSVTGNYAHGIVCKDKLKITGGDITITAKSDGLHVNDAVFMEEANLKIKAVDDGITVANDEEEGEFYICSGTLDISGVFEGIEAVNLVIDGGELNISCSDDGINATSMKAGNGATINGGTISIINTGGRDADGIDSNRDIIINGGTVFVSVPSDGNALDCGSESGGKTVINGGNVIACGGTMMAEAPDTTSTQCSFMYSVTGNAGDTIKLETSDGKELLSKNVSNAFSAVTISMPELVKGEKYKLTCGSSSIDVELTDTVTSSVDTGGFRGGPGGGHQKKP